MNDDTKQPAIRSPFVRWIVGVMIAAACSAVAHVLASCFDNLSINPYMVLGNLLAALILVKVEKRTHSDIANSAADTSLILAAFHFVGMLLNAIKGDQGPFVTLVWVLFSLFPLGILFGLDRVNIVTDDDRYYQPRAWWPKVIMAIPVIGSVIAPYGVAAWPIIAAVGLLAAVAIAARRRPLWFAGLFLG